MANEILQTLELEKSLFAAESHDRAPKVFASIKGDVLHPHSVIRMYQADLRGANIDKLPPTTRFIVGRNPWRPFPATPIDRFEALEELTRDSLSPRDLIQAHYLLSEAADEVNKQKVDQDHTLKTVLEEGRAHFFEAIYPKLKQEPISITDHVATKQRLRNLKTGDAQLGSGEPIQVRAVTTLETIINIKIQETLADLTERASWDPNRWVQETIESHMTHQQKLANEIVELEEELAVLPESAFVEQAQLQERLNKSKQNYIFLVSNLALLQKGIADSATSFSREAPYAEKTAHRESVDEEISKREDLNLNQVRGAMNMNILYGQSVNSLNSQIEAAKLLADKAKAELDGLKEAGRLKARAMVRHSDEVPELGDLGLWINRNAAGALGEVIEKTGIRISKNTVLNKLMPIGSAKDPAWIDIIEKHPGASFEEFRSFVKNTWQDGASLADFAEQTYFSNNPTANYFWEKFRPILSEFSGLNIAELVNTGQKRLVDQYLESFVATETTGYDLTTLEIRSKVENTVLSDMQGFLNQLMEVAFIHQQGRKLEDGEIAEAMKMYLSICSSFIDSPTSSELVHKYISEAYLGVKPMHVVLLKCGRWVSEGVAPTTGDYLTQDRDGNPVLRSKYTEMANQSSLLDTMTPLTKRSKAPITQELVVADSDIENALGFPPERGVRNNMDRYTAELTEDLGGAIQMRPLSEVLSANELIQRLRAYHYDQLARISLSGDPQASIHPEKYFTTRSHFERAIEDVHLVHLSIPGWRRSPSGGQAKLGPLTPYRYITEKYADYIAWMHALEGKEKLGVETEKEIKARRASKNSNTIIVVGGRDPISTVMVRASDNMVPILKVTHYSDYH